MTLVRYEVAAGVATLTLDSPANRNALSSILASELLAGLSSAGVDASVPREGMRALLEKRPPSWAG
jgi:enoyl-CoA hydratase/carnithine racemase